MRTKIIVSVAIAALLPCVSASAQAPQTDRRVVREYSSPADCVAGVLEASLFVMAGASVRRSTEQAWSYLHASPNGQVEAVSSFASTENAGWRKVTHTCEASKSVQTMQLLAGAPEAPASVSEAWRIVRRSNGGRFRDRDKCIANLLSSSGMAMFITLQQEAGAGEVGLVFTRSGRSPVTTFRRAEAGGLSSETVTQCEGVAMITTTRSNSAPAPTNRR